MAVLFFTKGIEFHLNKPKSTAAWLRKAIQKEKRELHSIQYIFCDDEHLSGLNLRYLKHVTLTDVITFNYSNEPGTVQGEIYISIERVRENAVKFKQSFDREVHRVLIHGTLHLIGYKDKTPAQKALMREKEEAYLSLL